ncbi:MAG: hypothetical protein JWP57_4531, partial [Spirosoma sp.]|nr:hypothetical protein [Spirosoma sp.]
ALREASVRMTGAGVIARMHAGGAAIASSVDLDGNEFERLALHPSDAVRQWACYAVCDPAAGTSVEGRLQALMRFADDPNMSVREAAWLAFRSTVAMDVEAMIVRLADVAASPVANVRRFAVEVTRPRSVWGAHLPALKRRPETARPLLEKVKADTSRYVQLAVGNWLNDASRTRPDWVAQVAAAWSVSDDRNTAFMVKRGTRTLTRLERTGVPRPSGSIPSLFAIGEAA